MTILHISKSRTGYFTAEIDNLTKAHKHNLDTFFIVRKVFTVLGFVLISLLFVLITKLVMLTFLFALNVLLLMSLMFGWLVLFVDDVLLFGRLVLCVADVLLFGRLVICVTNYCFALVVDFVLSSFLV